MPTEGEQIQAEAPKLPSFEIIIGTHAGNQTVIQSAENLAAALATALSGVTAAEVHTVHAHAL